MTDEYIVKLISPDEEEVILEKLERGRRLKYKRKAKIYGAVLKLVTDVREAIDIFERNFFMSDEDIRSHGRVFYFFDPDFPKNTILYQPQGRTCFMFNVDYYGKLKSIALSVVGDILEDVHDVYSVHGAALNMSKWGKGVGIIAPSGTGKTTHTFGLMKVEGARLVSDDWFFVRFYGKDDAIAYASEKEIYVRSDIVEIFPEFKELIAEEKLDAYGRAVVNLRWFMGEHRFYPLTSLDVIILLKRDGDDPEVVRELTPEEGLKYMVDHDYVNPHLLQKDERKTRIRNRFFLELFHRVKTYMVNTTSPPQETQRIIREVVKGNY
ncbi:MAG: HPr kinase/phosphorylase [Candidatus Freyarchaeota archaeon]